MEEPSFIEMKCFKSPFTQQVEPSSFGGTTVGCRDDLLAVVGVDPRSPLGDPSLHMLFVVYFFKVPISRSTAPPLEGW